MSPRAVARVVFDPDGRPERLPLYADGELEVTGRSTARLTAGARVSFAAYFNAFPAWHWHAFTSVRAVMLAVTLIGDGTITVLRSDAAGVPTVVERREVHGGLDEAIRIELGPNADGGWLWFDLEAGDTGLELRSAQWQVDAIPRETRLASLSMTTMDKTDFALGVLARLAGDSPALAALDEVLVVDQGTRKIVDDPAFPSTARALGGRLRVIDQPNLGGSGGFSRGMLEVLDAQRSGAIILLDDDVELEPESIARGVAFAAYTTVPTIVGGHFFDLYRPMRLHAFAEGVTTDDFDWGPIGPAPIDFASATLRSTPSLHQPVRPDYNGWWCCLIPTEVIEAVGLALPAFLKWDDAEFGLRAQAAGYPTVSLPGMAVWHVSWLDKNDSLGWQSFFHARNRLVAALVDERSPGKRLPWRNLVLDLRYLLTMDYHVVELRHQAIESVLAGPDGLHVELRTRLGDVRATMREFPSGVTLPMPETVPADSGDPRPGAAAQTFAFAWGLLAHLLARRTSATPEAMLAYADSNWWRVMRYRHVLTVNSDATGLQVHVRDPRSFRRMLRRSIGDWRRMRRAWGRLGSTYRGARPGMVSATTWRGTLSRRG